jgi:hypothetical protein
MTVVFIEKQNSEFKTFNTLERSAEISVFGSNIKTMCENELKIHGINNFIYSTKENMNRDLSVNESEKYMIIPSDVVFRIDWDSFEKLLSKDDFICGIKGEIASRIGVFCTGNHLENLLKNHDKNNDFYVGNLKDEEIFLYSKKIDSINSYKVLLSDILNGVCPYILPEIAEGIYVAGSMPEGDFVVIPPVFIDENVQIEDGCVIGPDTVILSGTLIASDSCIRSSFVDKNCFISSNCHVEDSICFRNTSLCRNSVLSQDCVIGNDSIINQDIFLEKGTRVLPYTRLKSSRDDSFYSTFGANSVFYGLSPEKAAFLGGALGNAFQNKKIAVFCDGEKNAVALKLAVISGLMTTGVECIDFGRSFLSSIYYICDYCCVDFGVFVNGGQEGTAIILVERNKGDLSPRNLNLLNNVINSGKIKRCSEEECKSVRQIKGMQRMYIRNLVAIFKKELDFLPVFQCTDNYILSICNSASAKIGFNTEKETVYIELKKDGRLVSIQVGDVKYNRRKVLSAVSYYFHHFRCEQSTLWKFDGVYLSFIFLCILNDFGLDVEHFVKLSCEFFVADRKAQSNLCLKDIVMKLGYAYKVEKNENKVNFSDDDADIVISKDEKSNQVDVCVSSFSFEVADEIAGSLIMKIKEGENLQ